MATLYELGYESWRAGRFEEALAALAESVRRLRSDHRARVLAARCMIELGERERALTVLHEAAEGLLRRDYLLSSVFAIKLALRLNPAEKRLKDTLRKIHARTSAAAKGRAAVAPAPADAPIYEGELPPDLTGLRGGELCDRAFEVLLLEDDGAPARSDARPPLPLFADLEEEAFIELVERMAVRELRQGEPVVKQGDPGDSIFVLVAGKARVLREAAGGQTQLATLGGGALFGELAVLTGAPRTASVHAEGDLEVFEISRDDLNEIARNHPSVPRALAEFAQRRMAMNLLATAPLFTNLPGTQRAEVLSRFTPRVVAPGERVIRQGEMAPGLFLVLTGELAVVKTEEDSDIALGLLRDGDVFGEISLVTGNPATANVTATHKSAVAALPRESFEELVQSYPQVEDFLINLSQNRLSVIADALRPAEVIDADDLVEVA